MSERHLENCGCRPCAEARRGRETWEFVAIRSGKPDHTTWAITVATGEVPAVSPAMLATLAGIEELEVRVAGRPLWRGCPGEVVAAAMLEVRQHRAEAEEGTR